MATNTPNYNLKKPSSADFYNVDDQNENMDKIDAALKEIDEKAGNIDLTELATKQELQTVNQTVASHKADYEYQTPSVVGTQIRLTKQSDTSRLFFKLESKVDGNITISLDGGASNKNLVDVDGKQITSLDKGFVEIVAAANFFILRNKGGLSKADLAALITITNEAEANNDAIRAGVASAISNKGVPASPTDTWVVLEEKIGQIETGLKYITGTLGSFTLTQGQQKTIFSGLSKAPKFAKIIFSAKASPTGYSDFYGATYSYDKTSQGHLEIRQNSNPHDYQQLNPSGSGGSNARKYSLQYSMNPPSSPGDLIFKNNDSLTTTLYNIEYTIIL